MKIYIPTDPYWYGIAFGFFGPYVFELIVGSSWIIKLAAIWTLTVSVVVLFASFTLTAHKTIKEDAPLVKKYGKSSMIWVQRFVLGGLTLLFLLPTLPSRIKDIAAIAKGDAPLMRVGRVALKSGVGIGGLISEDIILDDRYSTPENTFYAFYFPPRYIKTGNTYEFFYLPNTHWILEARLIKEGGVE